MNKEISWRNDKYNTCPKCNGSLEYTNRFDEKTHKVLYECQSCYRLFTIDEGVHQTK